MLLHGEAQRGHAQAFRVCVVVSHVSALGFKRRGNTLDGFQDWNLEATARVWPMDACHIRYTGVPVQR